PIATPIAVDFGFNLIHFGIITVIAVEIGLLTPPFGISIFTVKSTLNDDSVRVESVFAGALPYIVVMLAVLALVAAFPQLALALVWACGRQGGPGSGRPAHTEFLPNGAVWSTV